MTGFYSIQRFREAITKLCAKSKEGYSSIKKDICNSFANKSIDEIRINRDMVLDDKNFSIIKLRVPNSRQNLSKKDGFRLIYLVHKQKEEVIFLYVYPKRGPQGLISVKEKEILTFLSNYIKEYQEDSLVEHVMNNDLGYWGTND